MMRVPSQLLGFLRVTVSVFFTLALAFVGDLLLHPDEVHQWQAVQHHSMDSVKKFTPWEFASRFIQELSDPPESLEERINRSTPLEDRAIDDFTKPTEKEKQQRAVRRVDDAIRSMNHHWQRHFSGWHIILRPPIALAVVLFTTFPSFLSLGFILTVFELVIGGLFVYIYVLPWRQYYLPPGLTDVGLVNVAAFVLLTVAAGTVVSSISWVAAQFGLLVFGKFLGLAEIVSVWLTMAGLVGFLGMKYAEVIAHHKAEVVAAKALHIE